MKTPQHPSDAASGPYLPRNLDNTSHRDIKDAQAAKHRLIAHIRPGSAERPCTGFHAALGGGISGMRIGVVRHFFERDIETDTETLRAIEDALAVVIIHLKHADPAILQVLAAPDAP
jgi:hypothetical protein